MHAYRLTGDYVVALESDSRKASIHAGSTGLTGLTGIAQAHMRVCSEQSQPSSSINKFHVRMKKRLITLLTLFKASIHAGFSVTGLRVRPVMGRKGA